ETHRAPLCGAMTSVDGAAHRSERACGARRQPNLGASRSAPKFEDSRDFIQTWALPPNLGAWRRVDAAACHAIRRPTSLAPRGLSFRFWPRFSNLYRPIG